MEIQNQKSKIANGRREGHPCPMCYAWTPGGFDSERYVYDRSEGLCPACAVSEAGIALRKEAEERLNRQAKNVKRARERHGGAEIILVGVYQAPDLVHLHRHPVRPGRPGSHPGFKRLVDWERESLVNCE